MERREMLGGRHASDPGVTGSSQPPSIPLFGVGNRDSCLGELHRLG
jgi:hypothetical protein